MLKLFTLAQSYVANTLYKKEEGQTMAEYGVVLAVITVGIIVILGFMSQEIQRALNAVLNALKTVAA